MTSQLRFGLGKAAMWSTVIMLILFTSTCNSNLHTPPKDRGDWVDPADMIHYDSSTRTMAKNVGAGKGTKKEDQVNCDEVLQPCLRREKELDEKLKKCEKHLEGHQEETPVSHAPFFRQFVKHFLKKVKVRVDEHDTGHFNAHIKLTGGELVTLHLFTQNEDEPPQSSHEILTHMITEFNYIANYKEPTLNDIIGEFFGGCQNIIILSLCITILVWLCTSAVKIHLNFGYSYSSIFLVALTFLFVVSVPWNWWHLYKKKVAERQAANVDQIPDECLGGKKSASQTFFDAIASAFTFQQDRCVKFHESLLIDPIWEVPPTKAIAVTITKFFLEPLEHIGQSFSLLIRGMLQDLPLHVWPIALLVLFIFVLLVMTMFSGYRLNFFHLIQVGPGERQAPAIAPSAEENRVQELTSQVSDLRKQLEESESKKLRLEESTRTEGRVMIVGPTLLPLPPSATVESDTESQASGDNENIAKSSTEEVPTHLVSSCGDSQSSGKKSPGKKSPGKKSPLKQSPKSKAAEKVSSIDSTDVTDKDAPVASSKTEVLGAAAKLTTECTDSTGTDSDIEIISQDDMTKL